jgi:hypothetical protein
VPLPLVLWGDKGRLRVDQAGGQIIDNAAVANTADKAGAPPAPAIECELQGTSSISLPLLPYAQLASQPEQPPTSRLPPTTGNVPAMLRVCFSAVFKSSGSMPAVTHGVEHHLVTTGPPIAAKFRRWHVTACPPC